MIDIAKAEKLSPDQKYFNISVLWIFYYRGLLRLLYWLRVPHEAVTAMSILSGVASAYFFFVGRLIPGAIALHIKDLFDACDGALARLTGRGHLIGRYLDSLGDFLVLTLVVAAITFHASFPGVNSYLIWGAFSVLSIFIQCSFFNFYQIAYVERNGIMTLSSQHDEASRGDLAMEQCSSFARISLKILHRKYIIVYGWQDKFVAMTDNYLHKRCLSCSRNDWYGDKPLMTLHSPLCFGTHIFAIILFALLGRVEYALVFISTAMNLYLVWLLYYRRSYFLKRAPQVMSDKRTAYRKWL